MPCTHRPTGLQRFGRAARRALVGAIAVALATGPAAAGTVRYYPAGTTPDARVVADILGGGSASKPLRMKMRGTAPLDEPAADGSRTFSDDDLARERQIGEAARSALVSWHKRVPAATPPAAAAPAGGTKALALAIQFENDSAELHPDAAQALDAVAKGMRLLGTGHVFVIEGHTSATGGYGHNVRLSKARALSVKRYLVGRGVTAASLRPLGLGWRAPLLAADPAAPENRRVQFRAA